MNQAEATHSLLLGYFLCEIFSQYRNIFLTVVQWWYFNKDNTQTVVEVFTEFTFVDPFFQGLCRSGNKAKI